MIKCIASDMDGTLFNSDEKISEENKKAIVLAQSKDIEVVIATGRSYMEANHALNEAELKCSVVALNGAVVWDKAGKRIASNPMDPEDLRKIRKVLEEEGIYFYEIYTNHGTYTHCQEQSIDTLIDILVTAMPHINPMYIAEKARKRFEMNLVKVIDDYDDLYRLPDIEFYKVLAFSHDDFLLGKAGGELKKQKTLAVSSSGKGNLEITSKFAQKGNALALLVAECNITLNDTMAIGDNYNDVSMFEKVGKPVAMGNAPEEIKQLCGEVTLTNDENGVAKAILKAINE